MVVSVAELDHGAFVEAMRDYEVLDAVLGQGDEVTEPDGVHRDGLVLARPPTGG